jgi:hypothetical protein
LTERKNNMNHVRRFSVLMLACCLWLLSGYAFAQGSAELRKTVMVSTMTEAALSITALVKARTGQDVRNFAWSSRYSDREWSLTGSGVAGNRKVSVTMSGFVWGDEGQDLLVAYSGSGMSGDEPILLHGRADWPYDKQRKDYFTTDFRHAMKLGRNSFWGWVTGAEILVGGVAGAGGAVVGTAAATGGLALGAAAWIGSAGAVAGSSALVSVSQAVKSLQETSAPVAAPALPPRPEPPAKGEPIKPQEGKIIVAMSKDGRIEGSGPDASNVVSGSFDNKSGIAKGEIGRTEKK